MYTHDDVFYFEYAFAMTLLELGKIDADVAARKERFRESQRKQNAKTKRRY